LRERVVEIMRRERVEDPLEAYERAVMETDSRDVESGHAEPAPEKIPGWDDPDDGGAAPGAGGAALPGPPPAAPGAGAHHDILARLIEKRDRPAGA
jgi:hypothetical protein